MMSAEQKTASQQKLTSMQEDLDHVTGKLQQAEQVAGQALLQEMAPKVQEVLREIIEADGIDVCCSASLLFMRSLPIASLQKLLTSLISRWRSRSK